MAEDTVSVLFQLLLGLSRPCLHAPDAGLYPLDEILLGEVSTKVSYHYV